MVIKVIFFTLVPNNLLPFAAIAHDHGPCEIVFFWIHPPVIPLDGHPGRLSLNEPLMNSMPEPRLGGCLKKYEKAVKSDRTS